MTIKKKNFQLQINPTIGKVTAEYTLPQKSLALLTLAHGAGAGMQHAFMVALTESLAAKGIATLRFNFPFSEKKKFRPDPPAVAHATIAAAIEQAHKTHPDLPLFAAGKSFGGRMSSQYLSVNPQLPVRGIIFYGFPLHQAGNPSMDRAEHLKAIKLPMLFLQGTKDTLANIDLLVSLSKSLRKSTLVKFENADHSFKTGKQDNIEALATATSDWIKKNIAKAK